ECGATLPRVEIAYRTWGRLAAAGDNAVLVCHALTGSADVDTWWGQLLGPGRALDTDRDFVVCSNVLGSCYGTTGPASRRPGQRRRWGPDFPPITVRDMVHLQALLLEALDVRRLRLVIGGSLGGMQALEWAATFPARVDAIVSIAAPGRHSAWAIGLSEAQRAAIETDPFWEDGWYGPSTPPAAGLAAARMLAMCTYRSWESFAQRFGRTAQAGDYAVVRYLRHQGDKLVDRFDANCYVALTRAMDSHDLGRGRGGYAEALGAIQPPTLVVAIDSDALYPPEEQWELAERLPKARLAWLHSPHGHDAFLIETGALAALVTQFRTATDCPGSKPVGRRKSRVGGAVRLPRTTEQPSLDAATGSSDFRPSTCDLRPRGRGGAPCAS
ncbi:MAG: homoserine O-acetyltransferase, partial [Holophagae bacterium]|nr:homoserine O-acetyltransferase [Holophagae bacterium]